MRVHPFYTLLVFGAVAWLWNNRIELPTVNPGEAIGFDMVAIGLPLGLLWWTANRLRLSLKEKGVQNPKKVVFGIIFSAGALVAAIDLFTPAAPHAHGALVLLIVFGVTSMVLFVFARRDQIITS
jgi:hypothetical protein